MRKYSTLPCAFQSLDRDIIELQESVGRKLRIATCSSDCYCRKQGNHKVTNSLYHKQCIAMKKTTNASVQKTDITIPRRKCIERVNVFNMNKARVEIEAKKVTKDKSVERKPVKSCPHEVKRVIKFIDKGTDPITVLESKTSLKQSWSDILTSNKSNVPSQCPKHTEDEEVDHKRVFRSPKVKSRGSHSPTFRHKKQSKVILKDCGTQSLDEITKGDLIPVCLPRIATDSISNPIISLQALVKELKDFRKRVSNQKDYNTICCIISEMEIALNNLTQQSKPSSSHLSNKHSSSNYSDSKENVVKSSKSDRLYKNLGETCNQLRIACQQLEETCERLRNEKDHVTEKFFEKSREVESCLKRELEYQAKLSEASKQASSMSLQLDHYSKSVEELSGHVRKLQEENRALENAEEEKIKLRSQLLEASRENDKLNAELKLLTLEREKNRVLLDIKEKELENLRKQLHTIGGLVSDKMKESVLSVGHFSNTTLPDLSGTKEIAFSSPDGSLTSPSKSWKAMSTITSVTRPQPVVAAPVLMQHKIEDSNLKPHKGGTPPLESIKHLKNELRELFAQMKKQTEVSEALLLPELRAASEGTVWSSITDSSDGYISITDADCSSLETT